MATMKTYTKLEKVKVVGRTVVARDEDAYIGRVFEGGLWSFDGGRELLVSALRHPCGYNRRDELSDAALHDGDLSFRTWRSRDGGETWKAEGEVFNLPDVAANVTRTKGTFRAMPESVGEANLVISSVSARVSGEEKIVMHVSLDSGKTWAGPGIATAVQGKRSFGQSSALIRQDGALLFFNTGVGPHDTLRTVVIYSDDLPKTRIVIGFQPDDPDFDRVCPSAVAVDEQTILCAFTQRRADSPGHTMICRSDDMGRRWRMVGRANEIGQPGHLAKMPDGRLLLTYGWPLPPYRILARISEDEGATWGPELLIREGGGSADLGSVRSVVRDDGRIVSVYQWNDANERGRFYGGRRYVAATVWEV
jgi:hypothetical protein